MPKSDLFHSVARFIFIITLSVWLFSEVSRIPSSEIASVREIQWATFEQRVQGLESLESQLPVEASAQQLLADRPLDNRALRLFAFLAEKRQDHDRAMQLMQLAFERSKADAVANAWLVEAHLDERNWEMALMHFDAGTRVYGPLQKGFSPVLLFMSENPTGAATLSEHLKANRSLKNLLNRALQETQTAVGSAGSETENSKVTADQPDASNPPQIVQNVLREIGANRENGRCAAAVEGRPPRSESDRLCSGAPALFVMGPLQLE